MIFIKNKPLDIEFQAIGSPTHCILAHIHKYNQMWKQTTKLKTGAVFTNFLTTKAFKSVAENTNLICRVFRF